MGLKLNILRNERSTHEVHIESPGTPPKKSVGGLSLNKEQLEEELKHHGCSEQVILTALEDLEKQGYSNVEL